MQQVLDLSDFLRSTELIDPAVRAYMAEGQTETYESFDDFNLIAFDWYDLQQPAVPPAQMLIYQSAEHLLILCENADARAAAERAFQADASNTRGLALFFNNLLRGSTKKLEQLENELSELDDDVADGTEDGLIERLLDMRNRLIRVKKYFDQLEFLFEEICDNDNGVIENEHMRDFEILRNRAIRLRSQSQTLRETLNQVRDSYQAQIGIEQNHLMKVFTMVTSIFLPLTLIVGWYGMNLQMPEFGWKHGYAFVIVVMALVCAIWYIVFKKKKWL